MLVPDRLSSVRPLSSSSLVQVNWNEANVNDGGLEPTPLNVVPGEIGPCHVEALEVQNFVKES